VTNAAWCSIRGAADEEAAAAEDGLELCDTVMANLSSVGIGRVDTKFGLLRRTKKLLAHFARKGFALAIACEVEDAIETG